MLNRDTAKLIKKHALPVYVGALTAHDVVMVRAYKDDILRLLADTPDGRAFDPSVQSNAIFLHNADPS